MFSSIQVTSRSYAMALAVVPHTPICSVRSSPPLHPAARCKFSIMAVKTRTGLECRINKVMVTGNPSYPDCCQQGSQTWINGRMLRSV